MATTRYTSSDIMTARHGGASLLPVNIIPPVITGTQGGVLSVDTGTWINGVTGYTYYWVYNGVAVAGATSSTFDSSAFTQFPISVRVTATNPNGSYPAHAVLVQGGGVDAVLAKIIAAFANGGFPTTMPTPPTVAQSTTGNSAIDGSSWTLPPILLNDARIRSQGPIGPVRSDDTPSLKHGYGPAWTSRFGGVYTGGNGWEIAFNATGLSTFELVMSGFAASSSYAIRVFVDGLMVTAADEAIDSSTFAFYGGHRKYTFAGAASRNIRVVCSKDVAIIGLVVNAGATISYPTPSPAEVNILFPGDSFVDTGGIATVPVMGTFAYRAAQLLGARMTPMGVSGQGYVLQVDGRTINQRIPLDGPRIPVPDMVLMYGSLNDNAQLAATIQTNVADAITQARLLWPNSWIVFLSSFSGTNAPMNPARNAAAYNGAMSVADAKTLVIDTNTLPLEIAATTGTLPNGQAHDSPEGVHWGYPNEIGYNDGLIVTSIKAGLQKKLTIFGLPSGFTRNVAFTWTPSVLYASGAVTFALSGAALPTGLSFNTSTGTISGTPTVAGTTAGFVITATETVGNTATIGPFQIVVAAGAALTSFDPANNFATLSESNIRMTVATNNTGSRSTSSRSSGKQYAEFQIVATASGAVGLANASGLLNTWMAANGNGIGIDPSNGNVYSGGSSQGASGIGTLANNDILQVKLDRDAGTLQFGKNNTFGNVFNIIPSGALFLAGTGNAGLSVRVRTETTQFSYAVPSGYTAWN